MSPAFRRRGGASVVLAATFVVAGAGPAPGPIGVRCDPGGACGSPVAPTLRGVAAAAGFADLATAPLPELRREVRVWSSDTPPRRGQLRRFVEDTAGRVTAEELSWWSAADTAAHAEARRLADVVCRAGPIQSAAGVELCTFERVGMPYAANRLRTLGTRGVWTLRGRAGAPRRGAPCVDVCMGPGYLVVELREGRRYRTYGYPYGAGTRTPYAAFTLFHNF